MQYFCRFHRRSMVVPSLLAIVLAMMLAGMPAQAKTSAAQPSAAQTPASVTPALQTSQTAPAAEVQAPANAIQAPAPTADASAAAVVGGTVAGGIIKGGVKAGGTPLPGVSVTATNTLTGKKYTTTTDITGAFTMTIPKNGRYVLKAELAAFATDTKEALLNATTHEAQADFALQLASRASQQEAQQSARAAITSAAAALGLSGARGAQSLNVLSSDSEATQAGTGGGDSGTSMPSIATLGGDSATATESVAVSGQMGSVNPLAGISEDDIHQRIQDIRAQGGNPADLFGGGGPGGGGPGGGGRGGRGGFGGGGPGVPFSTAFRKFNPAQPHGSLFYIGGNSALNAKNFSLTGQPIVQPAYNSNQYGVTLTGSPIIPHVLTSTSNFMFVNFTGNKSSSPFDQYATVPTVAERAGDFSGFTNSNGKAVNIYDPATGKQFNYNGQANVIDPARITAQSRALLQFYPAPNLPGTQQNYHTLTTASTDTDNINTRFIHNFGGGGIAGQSPFQRMMSTSKALRQNLNIGFNYSHAASDNVNIFAPLDGKNQSHNYNVSLGYVIGYGRLTNNLNLTWNRSHSTASNLYTNNTNVAANSGITVGNSSTSGNPFNFGVPRVSFSTFSGFADAAPSDAIGQTISFSEGTSWSHKKHNMRYGGDFRRIHADSYGGTNVFGGYTFTGYATRQPGSTPKPGAQASGSDFADYLLGLPQQSTVQASNYKHYLRANVWDLYAQDDWRARPNLTLTAGLRYEYFSPYAERFDRIANLDYNSGFTAVAEVFPNGVGSVSGQKSPHTLINPDRNMFSPRFGFAWRVMKNTVLRGGYGINYNTGQYQTIGRQLVNQPPFAQTQTNVTGQQGCGTLTLANAFNCNTSSGSGTLIQNSFAVNANYRLGRVQTYNLDLQRTLPDGIVLNIDYNGSHGGGLDDKYAPNISPTGTGISYAQAFTFDDSLAFSNFNALLISARRRLHNGIALSAQYQYSHSIDDASSIGGAGNSIAQNPTDLIAEEGNSTFDIRHQVSGNFLYELPLGKKARFVTTGFMSHALEGLSVSGAFDFAGGKPFSPFYAAAVREVARGTAGSLRPDRVPGSSLTASGGTLLHWFNTSAFATPAISASNLFGYGNASRNSITGPGTVSVNMSLSKTASFGDTRSLEVRATANNVFNTVQYSGIDTTLGSPTFGQVTSVATMRRLTVYARYRF